MLKLYIIFCLLILGNFDLAMAANRGGDHGENGGDAFSISFVDIASSLLSKAENSKRKIPLSLEDLKTAILETKVVSEEQVFLGEREVDAINIPSQKLIRISRSRLKILQDKNSGNYKFNLVLHEYLGIMGIDDSTYKFSSAIVETLYGSTKVAENELSSSPNAAWLSVYKLSVDKKITCPRIFLNLPDDELIIKRELFCEDQKFQISFERPFLEKSRPNLSILSMIKITVADIQAGTSQSFSYTSDSKCTEFRKDVCPLSGSILIGGLKLQLLRAIDSSQKND